MPDLGWFDLLKNNWPGLPAPCQLHDITHLIGFPVSSFLDVLKAGKMLYSAPFPTLHGDTAQLAVGKYPKAPPLHFKVFVKLANGLTCETSQDQRNSMDCGNDYHLKYIECAFEFQKGGAYSVLGKYFVLSQTESIYVSDDIAYPAALAASNEHYGSEYFRVRFVYDNNCKKVVDAHFPNKTGAQVQASFVQNLASLLTSGAGSDITFKFNGEDDGLPAHKAFLIAQSNVFKNAFQNLQEHYEKSSVLIHDFTKEEFQLFLQFVYTGQLSLGETVKKYLAVLRAAQKYHVLGLTEYASTILGDRLDVTNVTDVLIQADTYGAEKLVDKAVKFVVKNAKQTVQQTLAALQTRPKLCEKIMCALVNKL